MKKLNIRGKDSKERIYQEEEKILEIDDSLSYIDPDETDGCLKLLQGLNE